MLEWCPEDSFRKGTRMVDIRRFERRLQAMEDKGFEVEVIGRKGRFEDLRRKLELGRFLKRLILTHGGRQLVIALVDAPELHGDHVSLYLALKIPVERKGTRLSKADKSRLESFLDGAIQKSSRSLPTTLIRPRPAPEHPWRRASSGM